jgi:tripartite-type tricarboxylate transporter receptor subunit TctC
MGRLVAEKLTQVLGVTVIVDNRSGGSGTVGAEIVRQAAPDGYTLLAAPSVFVLGPHVLRSVPYDPVNDFTPVMRYGEGPLFVLANTAAVPGKTIADVLPVIRTRPHAFAFGYRR